MIIEEDDPVWCMVMFDLPVGTADERRAANAFRAMLLDLGLFRVQFSVYCQYRPKMKMCYATVSTIRANLPAQGEVRVIYLTDTQWAKSTYFCNLTEYQVEEAPLQMTIF